MNINTLFRYWTYRLFAPGVVLRQTYEAFRELLVHDSRSHELMADLEAALPFVWGRRVISVFIGGGTPSLFSPDAIAALIADARARLPLEPGAEITLDGDLLSIMEALYHEVTAKRALCSCASATCSAADHRSATVAASPSCSVSSTDTSGTTGRLKMTVIVASPAISVVPSAGSTSATCRLPTGANVRLTGSAS